MKETFILQIECNEPKDTWIKNTLALIDELNKESIEGVDLSKHLFFFIQAIQNLKWLDVPYHVMLKARRKYQSWCRHKFGIVVPENILKFNE